jgi:ribosomal protein S18 acetylase RimI-like enzyme
MTFRTLSSSVDPTREIPVTLPWVHAASQPYTDWLLGDRSAAVNMLEQWMRLPASEVFIGRAVVLVEDARQVGGYIAVSGSELANCRAHDAVAAVAATAPVRRSKLVARMRLGSSLLPATGPDELYLTRMGVHAEARGCGYGKAIVHEYLRRGIRDGVRRFSLDVCSDNVSAVELYRSVGFQAEQRRHAGDLRMTYVRMVLVASREQPAYEQERDRAV